MKSPVMKRSVVVAGHKTSVSLEEPFWSCLKEIAAARSITLSELSKEIDKSRDHGNLSSAIRLFALSHYQERSAPNGDEPAEVNSTGRASSPKD